MNELSDGDEIRFGPEKVVYFSPEGLHKLLCNIMRKDAGNQSENEILSLANTKSETVQSPDSVTALSSLSTSTHGRAPEALRCDFEDN